jgi:hypothetical protein
VPTEPASMYPRESLIRNVSNKGYGAVAEAAQGFKGDWAEAVAPAVVVAEVFLQFFLVSALNGTASLPGGAMQVSMTKGLMQETSLKL